MAIIPQKRIFEWEEIEKLEDLERLELVLEYMPDEELIRKLERERGKGRDDYPVRAMWNAVLAGVIYQHPSIESLLRELKRNGQLRQVCGFKLNRVPTSWAFSRFLTKLIIRPEEIEAIFNELVRQLTELLPDFGETLAGDGKAIATHARPYKNRSVSEDGRGDTDADFGKKVYRGERQDGTLWEKIVSWFGYKLHLLVDANYELPVAFRITKASCAEEPQAHALLSDLEKEHPEILNRSKYFTGDKGLDDGKLIQRLWDDYRIKPVIDIRNLWKGDATRLLNGQDNIVYDYQGRVYCYCPDSGQSRQMLNGGFEVDRGSLKKRCPAEHFNIVCEGKEKCSVNKAIRIPIKEERRVFTPLPRDSYKWGDIYKKRTSVERVNGRLDVSFGFENHFIRGQKKMKMRMGLALCVMLAMAVGRIKEKQKEKMRSLVQSV